MPAPNSAPASVPRTERSQGSPAGRALLEERAIGAYLGLAVGDALGATVEFMTAKEIAYAFRRSGGRHAEIVGGGWLRLRAGQVTDDTTMALALGRAILACAGRVDALACARSFDAWMRARPVDIGHTVRRGIVRFRHTGAACMPPSEDAGNGAVMRCLPVALALAGADAAAVDAAALAQARVTHHNPLADAAVCCVVRMLSRALGGADAEQVLEEATGLAEAEPAFRFAGAHCDNPGGYVVETFRAVMQALSRHRSFESCLVDVTNRGGDADTTGAIAGMLAGALAGAREIPSRWLAALDAEVRAACEAQAVALLRFAPAYGRG